MFILLKRHRTVKVRISFRGISALHIRSHPALPGAYLRLISLSPRPELIKSSLETTQLHAISSTTTPSKFSPCLSRPSGNCSSPWVPLSSHGKHFRKVKADADLNREDLRPHAAPNHPVPDV